MLAHFTLPNVPEVARRTLSMVLVIGVAALVASVSFEKPLLGLGACLGLGLGTLNFRMVGNSVDRVAASGAQNRKRPLALNTFGRLGIITVLTLGLMTVSHQLGFGILGGLAVFQIILIANVARSMAKAGPMTSVEDIINANVVDDNIGQAPHPPSLGSSDDTKGGS
jgi:hypothetical protein